MRLRVGMIVALAASGCGRAVREGGPCTDGSECEPNDLCDEANGVYVDSGRIEGALSNDTDVDFFMVELSSAGALHVYQEDLAGDGCGLSGEAGTLLSVRAYYPNCTVQVREVRPADACLDLDLESIDADTPVTFAAFVSPGDEGTDPSYAILFQRF